MDYLEGALLGRYWSDTDFETRRHRGLELMLSAAFWLLLLAGVYFINFRILPRPLSRSTPWLPLFAILFLVNPLIGHFYYRMALPLRFVSLGVLLVKYVAFFLAVITALVPVFRLPEDFTLRSILEFFEGNIGQFVENQTVTYGTNGLILSMAVTVIGSGLLVLLFIYLMVKIPFWLYTFISWLQRIYDEAVDMYIRRRARQPKRTRRRLSRRGILNRLGGKRRGERPPDPLSETSETPSV